MHGTHYMTAEAPVVAAPPSPPRRTGRLLPAVGLFFLSPIVAEFLLGNLPITAFGALVLLAPMYGGGALLIREVTRRTGRGWPTMLLLALAYGVLEEGIATMSLFNPNYAGQRLLDPAYVPWLGIGMLWTVFVLGLHTIWSISVPIALVESFVPADRARAWLGWRGLAITGVLFVLGVAANTIISVSVSQFVASVPQLVGAALLVVLVSLGAFQIRRDRAGSAATTGWVPNPWLLGVGAFVATGVFKTAGMTLPPWPCVALFLAMALVAVVLIRHWSRHRGWGEAHRLALAGGALLTYAWTAFPQRPVLPVDPTVDLIGNAVFAIGALALLVVAALRLSR